MYLTLDHGADMFPVCSHFVLTEANKEMVDTGNLIGHSDLPVLGADLRRFRLQLGMTQAELSVALKLGETSTPGRTVRRWETKESEPVPGPVQLALEVLAARARRAALNSDGKKMKHDRMNLADGEAEHVGEGVFVVFQEDDGVVQTVILTPSDLAKMIAANAKGDAGGLVS